MFVRLIIFSRSMYRSKPLLTHGDIIWEGKDRGKPALCVVIGFTSRYNARSHIEIINSKSEK